MYIHTSTHPHISTCTHMDAPPTNAIGLGKKRRGVFIGRTCLMATDAYFSRDGCPVVGGGAVLSGLFLFLLFPFSTSLFSLSPLPLRDAAKGELYSQDYRCDGLFQEAQPGHRVMVNPPPHWGKCGVDWKSFPAIGSCIMCCLLARRRGHTQDTTAPPAALDSHLPDEGADHGGRHLDK
jgi:hypothetical protein